MLLTINAGAVTSMGSTNSVVTGVLDQVDSVLVVVVGRRLVMGLKGRVRKVVERLPGDFVTVVAAVDVAVVVVTVVVDVVSGTDVVVVVEGEVVVGGSVALVVDGIDVVPMDVELVPVDVTTGG